MITTQQIQTQIQFAKDSGLMSAFSMAAFRTGIDSRLLMAVASRESHVGLLLDGNYLGDGGNGIGIMQVDRRYHPDYAQQYHPGNHRQNILKGAQILKEEIERFGGELGPALAAYNSGSGNVSKALANGQDPDRYTTGGDYSKDVLRRYEIIKEMEGSGMVPGMQIAGVGMDTIAGIVMLSAAAGTAYLIFKGSK